ncbi:MAG TPA: hypothetical protein PKV93_09510 [Fervidobacterium sp.]|nr:hypothetical protein [Fervidobacterium sp.]
MLGPTFATWLGAILTLVVFSFLFGENPAWRFVEHVYIGFTAAHAISMGWRNIDSLAVKPIANESRLYLLIPCILGVMLYSRFFPRYSWLSRYPMAFLIGCGTGMILKGVMEAQFISQIRASVVPIVFDNGLMEGIGSIVIILGTICVLLYFYFSDPDGVPGLKQIRSFGRFIMMIAFGATFGNAVMGEMTLFIGRLQFLYGEWLNLMKI